MKMFILLLSQWLKLCFKLTFIVFTEGYDLNEIWMSFICLKQGWKNISIACLMRITLFYRLGTYAFLRQIVVFIRKYLKLKFVFFLKKLEKVTTKINVVGFFELYLNYFDRHRIFDLYFMNLFILFLHQLTISIDLIKRLRSFELRFYFFVLLT